MSDFSITNANIEQLIWTLPIPVAVYRYEDKKVVTVAISRDFLDLFDCTSREEAIQLMDNDMYRDTHPDDVARIADLACRFATEGGTYDAVYRSKTRQSGEYFHLIHATGRHMYTPDRHRIAVVWYIDETYTLENDASEDAQRLMDALRGSAEAQTKIRRNNYDDLTGLPNMTYFLQFANAERQKIVSKNEVPVVLFMDLNGLKYYNHQYGFEQGDRLIRTLGRLISSYFGSDYAGRFAADHFAVLTTDAGLTEKLNGLFAQMENACDGRTIPLRVGIYEDTFGKVSMSTACDRAKIACDLERNIYKSRFVYFDREMLEKSNYREYILSHLDEALEKHWILDYYQPIIRAQSGRVCDEEALARWQDPENGMLRPDQFITVLEDAGLLYKLDLYMVDRVIDFIRKKQKLGIPVVPVSVNLSERDFIACDMVQAITQRLDAAGVDRKLLTIEITERSIGKNPELLKNVIDRFHENGFSIWLDDFGSDYSSLNVLQDYRFELIKLDMKFLRRFNSNDMSRLIISEVLDLAKKAKMETVTEGVETTEQVAFLSDAGCIKLQGFLYSKPVAADEILRIYQSGETLRLEETSGRS